MRETTVQRSIWLGMSIVSRLFRINTGKAWLSGAGPAKRLPNGDVIVPSARPVALGLGMPDGNPLVGAADLQGWTSVTVTPEMVGCRVAVYTSIECKETGGGKRTPQQNNFIDQVRIAGGIAGFASSAEEALSIVSAYRPPMMTIKKDVGAS